MKNAIHRRGYIFSMFHFKFLVSPPTTYNLHATDHSIKTLVYTRIFQMFQCNAVTILVVDWGNEACVRQFIDDEINLAHVIVYNGN